MGNKHQRVPYKVYKGHFSFPAALLELDDMKQLSARAMKLLVDLGSQFNGYNNGDLCCAMSILRERGWNSNDQVQKAKRELIARNLIMQTKAGGVRRGPSLFALTWHPIMECGGKLDVERTTNAPRSLRE